MRTLFLSSRVFQCAAAAEAEELEVERIYERLTQAVFPREVEERRLPCFPPSPLLDRAENEIQ